MDPLTQALVLANTIARIIELGILAQPMEVRAERARIDLDHLHKWLAFLETLKIS